MMARKSMRSFIREHAAELREAIRKACPNCRIDEHEMEMWIRNDEGLYHWARGEGVKLLGDETMNGIDLGYEEHCSECQGMCAKCRCNHPDGECDCRFPLYSPQDWHATSYQHEYDPTDDHDGCGPEEQGTVLIGSWIKVDGKYEPDKSGEYAAIVNETTTQVVWSRHTKRCALCSPCYPGQADLDTLPGKYGDILAYCLPDDLMGNEDNNG
jgi:hypothetical protein